MTLSQVDFEAAAQSVMMETLREVKRLRPKALWGVSPYPSCYSGDPSQTTLANSTGQCAAAEMALNDELLWLWKRCSALYPLLNLEKVQVGHTASCILLSGLQIQGDTAGHEKQPKKGEKSVGGGGHKS